MTQSLVSNQRALLPLAACSGGQAARNMNTIVVGLGFGDESKGAVVDAIVRRNEATCVVRYNGGAQAAHNVVTEDGRHHTFAQFGSGTFVPEVQTFLSKHMIVNPLAMLEENKALKKIGVKDALERTHVDERALVTTPYHRALNRLREIARREGCHGSCGMGVGETVQDFLDRGEEVIRMSDLICSDCFTQKFYATHVAMIEKVRSLNIERVRTSENASVIDREMSTFDVATDSVIRAYRSLLAKVHIMRKSHVYHFLHTHSEIVFEGAQGVLLDEKYGFQPYTTWTNTTSRNAYQVISEFELEGTSNEIGVIRTFMTRHGKGPFPTETDRLQSLVEDDHNRHSAWQGTFRAGWFDGALLNYALRVNGPVDSIAVTHVDKLCAGDWLMCRGYDDFTPEPSEMLADQTLLCARLFTAKPQYDIIAPDKVVDWIGNAAGVPISIISSGPSSVHKKFTVYAR